MIPFLFFGKETLVMSHFQEKLEHLSFEIKHIHSLYLKPTQVGR